MSKRYLNMIMHNGRHSKYGRQVRADGLRGKLKGARNNLKKKGTIGTVGGGMPKALKIRLKGIPA